MTSLTVTAVLNLLNREKQIELFNILQDTLPESDNSIGNRLSELEEKYFDLVWLARNDDLLIEHPDIRDTVNKIVEKYPGELEKLSDEDTGDWTHGFNSGMLACVRLLRAYALPYNYKSPFDDIEELEDNVDEVEETDPDDPDNKIISYVIRKPEKDPMKIELSGRDMEIEFAEEEFPMLDT